MKAKFKGHCQWCGRLQMLPGGVLAKHGYEVKSRGEGGFFQGVCHGSGAAPYEESCGLIKASINAALAEASRLRAAASHEESNWPSSARCWVHVYHPELSNRSRGPVRLWQPVVLIKEEGDLHHHYIDYRGKKNVIHRIGSLDVLRREGAEGYGKHLRGIANSAEEYAQRQQRRIELWAPAPLIPI